MKSKSLGAILLVYSITFAEAVQAIEPVQARTIEPVQARTIEPVQARTIEPAKAEVVEPAKVQSVQPAPVENSAVPQIVAKSPKPQTQSETKKNTGKKKPVAAAQGRGLNQAQIDVMEAQRRLMWNATGGDMIYR